MKIPYTENSRKIYRVCSLLMALLFAYSACVQLNDPDWYFWFPLYTLACAVILVKCKRKSKSRRIKQMTGTALGLGLFLFVKVVAEDIMTENIGVLSLDLTYRVVREKIGSGLVIASVLLMQLRASDKYIDLGMTATVIFAYGLPFWFFTVEKGEIKI